MYKVQNTKPGNLPIDLEQGSITLGPGQTIDLDEHCSRKWIKTNILLQKLLAVKALRLVHDSQVTIPKAPIKKVVKRTVPAKRKRPLPKPVGKPLPKKPKIIDLNEKEDPTEKKFKKSSSKTTEKKSTEPKSKKKTKKTTKTTTKEDDIKDTKSKKSYKSKKKSSKKRKYSWGSDDD